MFKLISEDDFIVARCKHNCKMKVLLNVGICPHGQICLKCGCDFDSKVHQCFVCKTHVCEKDKIHIKQD
jgi:hypothetical protein